MLRHSGLVVLVLLASLQQATGQVTLERKYPPESKSVAEVTAKVHQILTLAGMDLETKSTSFILSTTTVGKPAEDGSFPVRETIDVLQTELGLPGGTRLQFDSANPDKQADNPALEPIMERLRVTFKTPVTTIMDARNKVKEVQLPAGVAESVGEANKSLFDTARRKKAAEQALGYLPDEAVKPGETWERAVDHDLGGGQNLAVRTRYTYVGTVEVDGRSFDKITARAFEVSLSMEQNNAPTRIARSDLKITESDETILFDRQLGAIQQKTGKVRIQGPITLSINGAELEGKLDLTIEGSIKRQK